MIIDKKRFLTKNIALFLILIIAFVLRIHALDFQSFWLDEIHTARESAMSLKDLFAYLYNNDSHPPLFYLVEKLMIILFGSSETSLRILPALAGTLSVWSVYLLGKEFYNRNLGLTAAALTCFNFFNLQYSQEARPYIFLVLFICFSFLYLVRYIKTLSLKNGLLYALFTLLALYTQYFALFVLISQCMLLGFCWLLEKEKIKFLINGLISLGIIAFGFAFRVPHLLKMSTVGSSWIQPTSDNFATGLFFEFFGNSGLLQPFILLFLILGLIYLFYNSKKSLDHFKTDKYSLLFIILFCWISFTLLIPYLRSVLVVPMIVSRYFITILPAFILILALGFEFIRNRYFKTVLLIFFCILSLMDITVVKKYYSTVTKSQFRELAQQISTFPSYPLNASVTFWQQEYYLQKDHFKGNVIHFNYDQLANTILKDSSLQGFWLADAHGATKPSQDVLIKISERYNMVSSINLHDAWGMLFLNKAGNGSQYNLYDYHAFPAALPSINMNDTLTPIWSNGEFSLPVTLPIGNYNIYIIANGTKAKDVYPHLILKLDNEKIGGFFTENDLKTYSFNFHQTKENNLIKIQMDNDFLDEATHDDRNAFIKSILILRN